MQIHKEILNNFVPKNNTEKPVPEDWDRLLLKVRIRQLRHLSSIYELGIRHGYECNCCEKILEEPRAYSTEEEKAIIKRQSRPGRPKLRG